MQIILIFKQKTSMHDIENKMFIFVYVFNSIPLQNTEYAGIRAKLSYYYNCHSNQSVPKISTYLLNKKICKNTYLIKVGEQARSLEISHGNWSDSCEPYNFFLKLAN